MSENPSRRDVIRSVTVVVAGVVTVLALPSSWTRPVIESVVTPAHAALSVIVTTTTTTTTTSTTTPTIS